MLAERKERDRNRVKKLFVCQLLFMIYLLNPFLPLLAVSTHLKT